MTVFETRLLLERTLCLWGAEAARLFSDNQRFVRAGAMPARIQKTLLGVGGVQALDGAAHTARKQLLISLLSPAAATRLAARFAEQWQISAGDWAQADRVVLHDAVARALARTVCGWAGVPLPETAVPRRTGELLAMIESPVGGHGTIPMGGQITLPLVATSSPR